MWDLLITPENARRYSWGFMSLMNRKVGFSLLFFCLHSEFNFLQWFFIQCNGMVSTTHICFFPKGTITSIFVVNLCLQVQVGLITLDWTAANTLKCRNVSRLELKSRFHQIQIPQSDTVTTFLAVNICKKCI